MKLHPGAAVLGMNRRNLNYIYPGNPRKHFQLADDKLKTKAIMQQHGIPVPRTIRTYSNFFEIRALGTDLAAVDSFVIKPATGSGGGGILVVASRDEDDWIGISGKRHTAAELKKHISDILFGIYSFDISDSAIIEERIEQHADMTVLSPFGLADIRVLLFRDEPVMSMTRLPTRQSEGRANLHQGAVGVGIDLSTGRTTHAIFKGNPLTEHPDTKEPLIGRAIPCWNLILSIAREAAKAVPLKYLGVDISVSTNGPVLLEINVRPGLEIQNANLTGLRPVLEQTSLHLNPIDETDRMDPVYAQ